jgi:hypothetical protein
MKNKQGIQLAFNWHSILRHQKGQQFMTFARIFIANGIDKIHTLSNESALLHCGHLCTQIPYPRIRPVLLL